MPVLKQEIKLSVDGAEATKRRFEEVERKLRDMEKAGADINRTMQGAERTSRSFGDGWNTVAKPISRVSEGLGKLTFLTQSLASLFGGVLGGALGATIGSFVQLGEVLFRNEKALARSARGWEFLNDTFVRTRSILDQIIERTKGMADARRRAGLGAESELAGALGSDVGGLSIEARMAMRQAGEERQKLQERQNVLFEEAVRLEKERLELLEWARRATDDAFAAAKPAAVELARQIRIIKAEYDRLQTALSRPGVPRVPSLPSPPKGPSAAEVAKKKAERIQQERWKLQQEGAEARIAESELAKKKAEDIQQERWKLQQEGAEARAVKSREKKAKAAGPGDISTAFGQAASEVTSYAGIIVGASQQITSAFGQAMTNLIISGNAGAAGIRQTIGNALAGLSAQAFGYSLLAAGLGTAAALSGPILGFTSPGLFKAAGVLAATGTVLAGMARGLGATVGGGAGAWGGGGGGGGGGLAGAGRAFEDRGQQGPRELVVNVNFSGQPLLGRREIGEAIRAALQTSTTARGLTPLPAR